MELMACAESWKSMRELGGKKSERGRLCTSKITPRPAQYAGPTGENDESTVHNRRRSFQVSVYYHCGPMHQLTHYRCCRNIL